MCPIRAEVNDNPIWTSEQGPSQYMGKRIGIIYYGDEFGGYIIHYDGIPVDSGALFQQGDTSETVFLPVRAVPPVEKGQPYTIVFDHLKLSRVG